MIEFCHLSKNEFNKYASKLFSVLHDNMTGIAPTGNSREDDYQSWYKAMCGEMQSDKRHIILISNENKEEIRVVEAYAHRKNTKSIGILEKLGLSIIGENKTGISYHFSGTYVDLLKWYKEV